MKPLVYFNDFKQYDETHVIVEDKRLQEILEEVYNAGFEDGKKTPFTYLTTNTYPNMTLGKEELDSNFGKITTIPKPSDFIYNAASTANSGIEKVDLLRTKLND